MTKADFRQAKYLENEINKLTELKEALEKRKTDFEKKIIITHDNTNKNFENYRVEFDINNSYGFFREDLLDVVCKTLNRVEEEFEKYVRG